MPTPLHSRECLAFAYSNYLLLLWMMAWNPHWVQIILSNCCSHCVYATKFWPLLIIWKIPKFLLSPLAQKGCESLPSVLFFFGYTLMRFNVGDFLPESQSVVQSRSSLWNLDCLWYYQKPPPMIPKWRGKFS